MIRPPPVFQIPPGQVGGPVAVPQAHKFAGGIKNGLCFIRTVGPAGGGLEQLAEGERDQTGQSVGKHPAGGKRGGVIGLFEEQTGEGEGLLLAPPVEKAALPPLAEVLFGDGMAAEPGGDRLAGGGLVVEPLQQGLALLAVVKAAVELVAHRTGQARDLASVGGDGISGDRFGRLRESVLRADGYGPVDGLRASGGVGLNRIWVVHDGGGSRLVVV